MIRQQKIWLGSIFAVMILAGLATIMGRLLTQEFRDRGNTLRPLVATNASLDVVIAIAGNFRIVRQGTPLWDETFSRYANGSEWDKKIAALIKKSSAWGHTTTMDMQTWIFLDERDRLIGFELGTQ